MMGCELDALVREWNGHLCPLVQLLQRLSLGTDLHDCVICGTTMEDSTLRACHVPSAKVVMGMATSTAVPSPEPCGEHVTIA